MPRPLVLSGPSGSGKTTLLNMLTKKYPGKFAYSVGYTTRIPRDGEVNGVHYNFVSTEMFQNMIKNDEMLEWSTYCSNYYGQAKKTVSDLMVRGIVPILAIDLNGVISVKQVGQSLNPKFCFIQTQTLKVLEERLKIRGTESTQLIAKRLEEAKRELDYAHNTPNAYDLILINNDIHDSFTLFEQFAITD